MPQDPLQKHTLNLRMGDYDVIQAAYAERGIAAAVVIRALVSKFADKLLSSHEKTPEIEGDI